MKLAILLTTYNAERFLEDLLYSLKGQTYHDWTLYVRDDISSDSTVDIIKRFQDTDERLILLEDGCKRGAMGGFMWLLGKVEADYYMFCDHDDVWKEDKIEVTLNAMVESESQNKNPTIVHTDLEVVDRDLKPLYPSFWNFQKFSYKDFNSKYFHLAYNNIPGCTMMLNREARNVSLPWFPKAQMHDAWVASCVLWYNGLIINIPKTTILYRQHGMNTLGAAELPPMYRKIYGIKTILRKVYDQALEAKEICGMSLFAFIPVKLYFMCRLYIRNIWY